MSNRADLKSAIGSVKVQEALRLQGLKRLETPVFVPPTSVTPVSQDINTTQDTFVSQDEIPPKDSGVDELGRIRRSTKPRTATKQDAALTLAAEVSPKLGTGYTRLPNSILMKMVSGDISRAEMKIILLIARLTISFKRQTVPLSKNMVERLTGVQGGVALQAIKNLEKLDLLNRIPGNPSKPTELGLNFDATESRIDSGSTASSVNFESQDSFTSQAQKISQDKIRSPIKDIINIKKISPLSLPENLRRYLDETKPQRKKESEWQAFEELKASYSLDDISDCLARILEHGIASNEGSIPCHSPMAFLAKAIDSVLAQVRTEREKAHIRAKQETAKKAQELEERERSERENREWANKEQAFNRAFPTENHQQEIIDELCRGTPFRANGQTGRTFAIGRWWSALNAQKQQELTT